MSVAAMFGKRKIVTGTFLLCLGIAVFLGTRESEMDSHRRALHRILVELFPDGTNWSRIERLAANLRGRRSSDKVWEEQVFRQSNLVRLGYFQVIDLSIPTNAYRAFSASAMSNQWACNLWTFSFSTSGVVHLVAFNGDIPRWKKLAQAFEGRSE
jgi:hypothetical protein